MVPAGLADVVAPDDRTLQPLAVVGVFLEVLPNVVTQLGTSGKILKNDRALLHLKKRKRF